MPDNERYGTLASAKEYRQAWKLCRDEYAELEAENERLRAALQRILDHGQTHDEPCYALHNGDCADVMQEIARATLDAR